MENFALMVVAFLFSKFDESKAKHDKHNIKRAFFVTFVVKSW